MKIVIDTREQKPYTFENFIDPENIITKKLEAGDYSIEGLESQIAIERKSLQDFVQTIVNHKARFFVELGVLKQYKSSIIIVEASYTQVLNQKQVNIYKQTLESIIAGLTLSASPTQIIFADNRIVAQSLTYKILHTFYNNIRNWSAKND